MTATRSLASLALTVWAVLAGAGVARQQQTEPVEPFRIAGTLYYVGDSDIGSYLIATDAGHFLIDGGFESTVPRIEASVAKLGFKLADIKFLLNTQAHGDHAGGFAALKKHTSAKLMVSGPDAEVIERGGARDFALGDSMTFPPAQVDGRLTDGQRLTLGKTTLTANLTPGHTMGCTTWSFDVTEGGRTLHVVDLCGLTILEKTRVSGMPGYPGIAKDYERTFAALRKLPIDIFIGAHPAYYGGLEKAAKAKADPSGPNPFIDPEGFRRMIDSAERKFREQLAREK
jgi:metallo-beta-lactamase class B